MQYTNYEEGIVWRYGVLLEGWTYDKLVNPSALSTAIEPLRPLHDALNDGTCHFVKLTALQLKEHIDSHQTDVNKGQSRKVRKDAGKKHRRSNAVEFRESDDDDEDEDGQPLKMARLLIRSNTYAILISVFEYSRLAHNA